MNKLLKHLKTIRMHRKYVRKSCWKMGLFWQGFVHDLSKYSLKELLICKYYVGTRSPHAVARDEIGYSPSWLNHYHKNKHHWQFWIDAEDWPDKIVPIKMPYKYVVEMFCDFIGAGKAYNKEKWTPHTPLEYYLNACKGKRLMHKQSEDLLVDLLVTLDVMGEAGFYKWYKENKKELKNKYKNC